jgi:hypothetical protein
MAGEDISQIVERTACCEGGSAEKEKCVVKKPEDFGEENFVKH